MSEEKCSSETRNGGQKKNWSISSPNSFLNLPFFCKLLEIMVLLIATFLFTNQQAHYQKLESDLRLRQQAMMIFSTNITQTINYLETSKSYVCLAEHETDSEIKKDYKKKSDEYYDKFLSLNPSYEIVFTQLKIYFNRKNVVDNQEDNITAFQKMFDAHMELLNNRSSCIEKNADEKNKYEASRLEIFSRYDQLINELTQELN